MPARSRILFVEQVLHNQQGSSLLNKGEHCKVTMLKKLLMMLVTLELPWILRRKQVDDGAVHIIDSNVGEGMLDGLASMSTFLMIAVTGAEILNVPLCWTCPSMILLLSLLG